jgi:hypothetical protein
MLEPQNVFLYYDKALDIWLKVLPTRGELGRIQIGDF